MQPSPPPSEPVAVGTEGWASRKAPQAEDVQLRISLSPGERTSATVAAVAAAKEAVASISHGPPARSAEQEQEVGLADAGGEPSPRHGWTGADDLAAAELASPKEVSLESPRAEAPKAPKPREAPAAAAVPPLPGLADDVPPPLPLGTGAIFRCSVCHDLVFESQLEYHVSVCPEPSTLQAPCVDELPASSVTLTPLAADARDVDASGAAGLAAGGAAGGDRGRPGPSGDQGRRKPGAVEESTGKQAPARASRPRSADRAAGGSRTAGGASGGALEVGMKIRPGGAGNGSAASARRQQPEAQPATSPESVASGCGLAGHLPSPRPGQSPPSKPSPAGAAPSSSPLPPEPGLARVPSVKLSLQIQKVWRKWEDSDLQVHQQEMDDRARRRRQRLQEELQRREEEECTFAPKLMTRRHSGYLGQGDTPRSRGDGSPRCTPGPSDHVERQRKLDRIEAEAYFETTHRPQLSPGSKAWARRGRLVQEGQPQLTVFERLYRLGVASQEAYGASVGGDYDAADGDACSGQGTATPRASSQPRLSPGRQRLYMDHFDRRQRRRSAVMQASKSEGELRRAFAQVRGNSRVYYWQMLERQIKIAFDAAACGGELLSYPALEDFLRHFGVLPQAPKAASSPAAAEHAAEESRRLRVALWRYLDPRKTGHVDFLTITVFFHVLMGAVDAEGDFLHNLSTTQQLELLVSEMDEGACWSRPDSPSARAHPERVARVSPGTRLPRPSEHEAGPYLHGAELAEVSNLQSWALQGSSRHTSVGGASEAVLSPAGPEQELPEAEWGGDTGSTDRALAGAAGAAAASAASALVAGAAAAAAAADPDGRQICQLLMQFNAKQLRQEFREVYVNRMHHNVGVALAAEQSESVERASGGPSPQLNPHSRELAGVAFRRLQDGIASRSGDLVSASHTDLLYWRQMQVEAKREELRAHLAAEEVHECTFHPSIASSQRRTPSAQRSLSTEAVARQGAASHQRLYALAPLIRQDREERAAIHERRQAEAELSGCTFQPNIKESRHSYARQSSSNPTKAPGFDECTHRMRKAFATDATRRRYLEDRFLACSPTRARSSERRPAGSPSTPEVYAPSAASCETRRPSTPVSNSRRTAALRARYGLAPTSPFDGLPAAQKPGDATPSKQAQHAKSRGVLSVSATAQPESPTGSRSPSPRMSMSLQRGLFPPSPRSSRTAGSLPASPTHWGFAAAPSEASEALGSPRGGGGRPASPTRGVATVQERPASPTRCSGGKASRYPAPAGSSSAARALGGAARSPAQRRAPSWGRPSQRENRPPQGVRAAPSRELIASKARPAPAPGASPRAPAAAAREAVYGAAVPSPTRIPPAAAGHRAKALPVAVQLPQSLAPAAAEPGPRSEPSSFISLADKAALVGSTEKADDARTPLVFIEVNIGPGRPAEKLVLYQNQSPGDAAADFAVMHRLPPKLAQRLHGLLKELVADPSKLQAARAGAPA